MRSRVPRKSVDFESIDLGDSLYSYPPGSNPNNLAPYKVRSFSSRKFVNLLFDEIADQHLNERQKTCTKYKITSRMETDCTNYDVVSRNGIAENYMDRL